MSYNNEITYHDKWDTMENNAALKKLDEKYFDRSICSPGCPVGWAPEVLELLEQVNKEFGIARNTQTIRAYTVETSLFDLAFKATYNNVKYSVNKNFLSNEADFAKYRNSSLKDKLKRVKGSFKQPLEYAFKVFKMRYSSPFLNKILRPKVTLSQVKEKYGYLTVYFHAPEEHDVYINSLVSNTVKKLVAKGAYYSAEQMEAMRQYRDGK